MRVVIEFHRIRAQDDAHALIGRADAIVVDLDGAISRARALARSLDMPQQPDAMTIRDEEGRTLHFCNFNDAPETEEGRMP